MRLQEKRIHRLPATVVVLLVEEVPADDSTETERAEEDLGHVQIADNLLQQEGRLLLALLLTTVRLRGRGERGRGRKTLRMKTEVLLCGECCRGSLCLLRSQISNN